jgi:hypothetical protein
MALVFVSVYKNQEKIEAVTFVRSILRAPQLAHFFDSLGILSFGADWPIGIHSHPFH